MSRRSRSRKVEIKPKFYESLDRLNALTGLSDMEIVNLFLETELTKMDLIIKNFGELIYEEPQVRGGPYVEDD